MNLKMETSSLYKCAIIAVILSACASQELSLCGDEREAADGSVMYEGSGQRCLCEISLPDSANTSSVRLHLHLSVSRTGGGDYRCFPKLAVKAEGEDTAMYICPDREGQAPRQTQLDVTSQHNVLLGVNNYHAESFRAHAQFATSPGVALKFTCEPTERYEDIVFAEDGIDDEVVVEDNAAGENTQGPDGTVIGVSVAVAVVLTAVLVIILIVVMKKKRQQQKGDPDKELGEKATGDENPGYKSEGTPVARPAPQYGNVPVNPNPDPRAAKAPYTSQGGMMKQSSVGNLSTASSVSSVGAPDLGVHVIQKSGANPGAPPPPPNTAVTGSNSKIHTEI